jgi:hypothetical protein
VCCSLLSNTSSMGRSGELSDFERGLVIGCHISKKSVRNIVTLLKLPKSMLVTWLWSGKVKAQPRLGRPCLMTNRDRRALKKVVRETCQTSSETHPWVTQCYELSSQHQDCASRVRGMGFHGRAAAHKPNILPVNTKRRLKWCKERRHWTVDNWKRVIWGDESHYTMWQSDGRIWVWRIPREPYLPACVVPTVKFGGGSTTVSGCFSWNGLGPLIILHENINAEDTRTFWPVAYSQR